MLFGADWRIALITAGAAAMGAGCAGAEQQPALGDVPTLPARASAPPRAEPPTTGPAQTTREGATIAVEPALEGLVARAVEDLAERLAVDRGEVAVVSAEPVVWPDASLGCPQPDMRYRQVPEDGALIQLGVAGRVYRYHTGGSRTQPFLCERAHRHTSIVPDPRLTPRFDQGT